MAETRTLEILDRLIAFPTVSRESNLELIDWVEALLSDAGFTLTRIPSPCGSKAGLFARIGPGTDGGVCLSAHTDVVPVDGQNWTRPPFQLTRDGDRLYGRGTTDMKGFLASALAMAERAGQGGLAEPLTLALSYDEEIGCVGLNQMLPRLAPLMGHPRAVIVGEPTSMRVAIGHKGKAALRITCRGEAGHSALAPRFVNAIHVASGVVEALRALQAELAEGPGDPVYEIPYPTVHVGRIAGGRALNIVPEEAVLDVEYRHPATVLSAALRTKLDDAVRTGAAAFEPPAEVVVEETNAYPALATDPESPVACWGRRMAAAGAVCKVAFGTEAGFFAELGLPTVVIGPGDMEQDGHKPDEGLDLSDLGACDAMLNRVLSDLRGESRFD